MGNSEAAMGTPPGGASSTAAALGSSVAGSSVLGVEAETEIIKEEKNKQENAQVNKNNSWGPEKKTRLEKQRK